MQLINLPDPDFERAIEKLDTKGKRDHAVQLLEIQLTNYKELVKNYPPDRMRNCGKPYLDRIEKRVVYAKGAAARLGTPADRAAAC